MKITSTLIQDKNYIGTDSGSKLILMDQIINHFLPLFRDEIEKLEKVYNSHQIDMDKLKSEVLKTKKELSILNEEYKRQKIIYSLLVEITQLYDNDILYGNNKKIVLDTLDGIYQMDLSGLQSRHVTLRKLVYKNIKKVRIRN